MDAPFAKENLNIKWHCESGLVDNIQKLIKEFKAARNLIVLVFIIYFFKSINKLSKT